MDKLPEERIKLLMDDCEHAASQGRARDDMDPHSTLPVLDVLSMATELLELRKQTSWNTDMSEAPKDGTRILACTNYGVEMVKYNKERYSPDVMGASAFAFMDGWAGCEQDSECLPEKQTPDHTFAAAMQPYKWRPLPPVEGK